jgi:L-ribulokinase
MASPRYSIGLDFGTESVRALLLDLHSGKEVSAVARYRHGVIEHQLPTGGAPLPADYALQDPGDYLESMGIASREALRQAKVRPESVVGVGVSATACTMLPVDAEGKPLCFRKELERDPHAWVKLWKHHGATAEAEELTEAARNRKERFLRFTGGSISPEWMFPKMLETLRNSHKVYAAAVLFVEAGDWIVGRLTGRFPGKLTRSACQAGYKAGWSQELGYPSADFLASVDRRFRMVATEQLRGDVRPVGTSAGELAPEAARTLGLRPGIAVGVAMIDAHAAALGAGLSRAGQLVLVMGTSTCHMTVAPREASIPGVSGVVRDGILPGLYGFEAGQSAVGDLFGWLVRLLGSGADADAAHRALSERAAASPAGANGLLALDWWNGNRSVLMNPRLTGLIAGLTLRTRPEDLYRALVESTAFGTRRILDAFEKAGLKPRELRAGGGLPERNPLLLQVYADVLGREIVRARSPQASALGAALLGAVAAGKKGKGFDSLPEAVEKLVETEDEPVKPRPAETAVYDRLYRLWNRLHDHFGNEQPGLMSELRQFRQPDPPRQEPPVESKPDAAAAKARAGGPRAAAARRKPKAGRGR